MGTRTQGTRTSRGRGDRHIPTIRKYNTTSLQIRNALVHKTAWACCSFRIIIECRMGRKACCDGLWNFICFSFRRGGHGGRGGYQDEYGADESFDSQDEMGQGWGNGGRGRPRVGPPRGGSTQKSRHAFSHTHALRIRP